MTDAELWGTADEWVKRARAVFNVEKLLIKGAYRVATQREIERWEYNACNVTPHFAARFLISRGYTFEQVMHMFS